jgi:hypothetical protein
MRKTLTALSMIFATGLVLVSNLGLAFGTSDGIVWTKYAGNPLDVGISDVGAPWVIYDGSIFRMWYCSFGSDLVLRIYSATSLNGIDWNPHGVALEPGALGSWDDRHVASPTVVFDGTEYRMWYTGIGHTTGVWGMVGYATSSNGIDWIKNESNPVLTPGGNGGWDDHNIAEITAFFNGSHYLMWYAGQAYENSQESMGIALSTDGIFWTKYAANPVMMPGPSSFDNRHVTPGGVVRNGTHYLMWYTGQSWSAPDRMGGDRIGLAISSDGFSWIKDENNPALNWGAAGSWETFVRRASVVKKDCGLMMWYQGIIPDPEVKSGKIGLATSYASTVEANVDFDPNTLNLRSNGRWITAYIESLEGCNVADINASSMLLNGTIPADLSGPATIGDYDNDELPDLMVKFDRSQVISYILNNVDIEDKSTVVTLSITGRLNDGTAFQGIDTIRVLYTGKGRFLRNPLIFT